MYKENFTKVSEIPIDPYILKYHDKDQFWDSALTKFPAWLTCGFPNAATWYQPKNSDLQVWDYSNSNGQNNVYESYLKSHKEKFHDYEYVGEGEPLRRWFSPGLVEPTWFAVE
ncbi:hypothetical protein ACQP3L_28385, partial [Escherichia coli]